MKNLKSNKRFLKMSRSEAIDVLLEEASKLAGDWSENKEEAISLAAIAWNDENAEYDSPEEIAVYITDEGLQIEDYPVQFERQ